MGGYFHNGYALLVGVGGDLPVTSRDARGLEKILLHPEKCAYEAARVRRLSDEGATRARILEGLQWLAAEAGPEDTVIVFYSGHATDAPEHYLVPFDFSWDDLASTAIAEAEFSAHLSRIRSRKLILLLDCCHAGGQRIPKASLPRQVLEEFHRGSGRVLIASSRRDEVSWTGDPYSVFTQALIEGLSGHGAAEDDGFARILDIAIHTGRMVPNRTSDRQHPILKVSDLSDNFAVARCNTRRGSRKDGEDGHPATTPPAQNRNPVAESLRKQLGNYRQNLLLIDERISEYIEFTAVPLQLVRSRAAVCERIRSLEEQLGE